MTNHRLAAFILACYTLLLSQLAAAASVPPDVCPAKMSSVLQSGQLKYSWMTELGTNAGYSKSFPGWQTTEEGAAYAVLSQYVAKQVQFHTSNLREIYGELDASKAGQAAGSVENLPGTIKDSVPNCDQRCWNSVITQIHAELLMVEGLADYVNHVATFLDDLKQTHVTDALASVLLLLEINAGDQVIATDNSLSGAWKTGWGIGLAIFGVLGLATDSIWVDALIWAASGVSSIGNGIISGQSQRFKINLDINNALYAQAANLTNQLTDFYTKATTELQSTYTTIAKDYGRLGASNQCLTTLDDSLLSANMTLAGALDKAQSAMVNGLYVSVYQQLLPTKFELNYQFKCNCLSDGPVFCEELKNPKPVCVYWSVKDQGKKKITIVDEKEGWWLTWLGTPTTPNVTIGQPTIDDLNKRLPKGVTFNIIFLGTTTASTLPTSSTGSPSAKTLKYDVPGNLGQFSLKLNKLENCEDQYHSCIEFNCSYSSACADCTYPICIESCGKHCGSCIAAGAGILMADGSTELIERIQSGDEVIDGHGAKRRVLFVEKALRNHRQLYQVNDLDFWFTDKQTFPTPDAASLATVRPQKVRRYNPSLSGYTLQGLRDASRTLLQWKDAKPQPLEILSLKASADFGGEDEIVYDLILDGPGQNSFIVNGVVVNSEMFDLSAAPKTTLAMIHLVKMLAENEDIAAYSKRAKNVENVDRLARFVLEQKDEFLLSIDDFHAQALKSPRAGYVSIPDPMAVLESIGGDDLWAIRVLMEEVIHHYGADLVRSIESLGLEGKSRDEAFLVAYASAVHGYLSEAWADIDK